MGVSGPSREREVTQHIGEKAADIMPHLVFPGSGKPGGGKQIRN